MGCGMVTLTVASAHTHSSFSIFDSVKGVDFMKVLLTNCHFYSCHIEVWQLSLSQQTDYVNIASAHAQWLESFLLF